MSEPTSAAVKAFCPTETQWTEVHRVMSASFGIAAVPDDQGVRDHLRPQPRRLAVAEGSDIVAGAFAYAFTMAMPGGARLPVAGLAGVSVCPSRQGQGFLRPLMQAHLENSLQHGDAASVLMASESGLYKRFGYGMATEMSQWQLHSSEYAVAANTTCGYSVRLIHDNARAISIIAPIYEKALDKQAGGLDRSLDWWAVVLGDDHCWIGGGPQFVAVVYDAGNIACGFALYKMTNDAETACGHARVRGVCSVRELTALDAPAEIALFNYLTSIALTRELIWELAPVRPRISHYLSDHRQLWQQARLDMMWLRPLDVAALLCNREYGQDGRIIIDYCDPDFEHLCAAWALTVGNGIARVEKLVDFKRSRAGADKWVALDSAALGSVILGGTRVIELAGTGSIRGCDKSIRIFDRLMLCDQIPFNQSKF